MAHTQPHNILASAGWWTTGELSTLTVHYERKKSKNKIIYSGKGVDAMRGENPHYNNYQEKKRTEVRT